MADIGQAPPAGPAAVALRMGGGCPTPQWNADLRIPVRHREGAMKKEVGERVRHLLRLIRSGVNTDKAE